MNAGFVCGGIGELLLAGASALRRYASATSFALRRCHGKAVYGVDSRDRGQATRIVVASGFINPFDKSIGDEPGWWRELRPSDRQL